MQNDKAHFLCLDYPYIPTFNVYLFMQLTAYKLYELNLTHGYQLSQHSENGPKIARNSETRWKLLSNIKTDDLSFKRKRNRVD